MNNHATELDMVTGSPPDEPRFRYATAGIFTPSPTPSAQAENGLQSDGDMSPLTQFPSFLVALNVKGVGAP